MIDKQTKPDAVEPVRYIVAPVRKRAAAASAAATLAGGRSGVQAEAECRGRQPRKQPMSDEKLRLEAQLRDNMSPGLRKIKDQLQAFRMTPGMQAATEGIRKLGTETAKFAEVGGKAGEAFGAMGIGGLAVAGSFTAVVAQMRELGNRTIAMKEFARETGVSADWLNVWSHAGLHFGVSADAMQSALNHLTGQMPEFKNKTGQLFFLLSQRFPTITKKLLSEGTEQQIKDITALLNGDKLKKDPQLQKQLANEFFGNGDEVEKLFKNGADGFWAEFNKQQKLLNPINPELIKQAQTFLDATIKFKDTLDNFENSAGPIFLKGMTAIVDKADELVHLAEGPSANGGWLHLWKKGLNMTTIGQFEERVYKDIQDRLHGKSAPAAAEQPNKSDSTTGALQGQSDFNKRLNDSLQNANPLFHKSAYMTGADVGLAGLISDGTKTGVLAAFRELMATGDTDLPAATGVPKFTRTSFEVDSPAAAVGRAIGLRDGSRNEGTSYHDSNAFYDAIIHSEGTAKHGDPYNTSLGYLKSPKPLTEMTNAEVLEWGDYIRKHTPIGEATNSSAKGAFQIVNTTQREAMKALGIGMSDLFSIENQRRMASWIAKKQGLGAWTSLPLHPKLEARAYRALRDGEATSTRRATGLSENSAAASRASIGPQGTIRADIHVHGDAKKAIVKSTGKIETKLHRWPKAGMEV